jgi:hypothetical protein
LTGSAALFISTWPEHPPGTPAEEVLERVYDNTILIPSDGLQEYGLRVQNIVRRFATDVGVTWTQEWVEWSLASGYFCA